MTIQILAFAASYKKTSLNKRLITRAAEIAKSHGAQIDLADFVEFDMPLYNEDLESESGLPQGTLELKRRIEKVDALMIASPEYNYGVPGTLKNAIDWLSRSKPVPLRGKSAYLMSASPSMVGGNRGLWQLRTPLEALGTLVYPDMFSLPNAHHALDEKNEIIDPKLKDRLEKNIASFIHTVTLLKS